MWKTVKLEDVCDFQNGFAFKSALFRETGEPILRISNIQNEKIDTQKTVYFNPNDYNTDFTQYQVKPNDLLIAMSGATTGKIGFNKTGTTYYLNQRVGNLKPKSTLDKLFLYYLMSTKVQENLNISKGTAQPNLSSEQIKNITFSLPPLETQQRIVSKLNTIFAEIDKKISNLTKKSIKANQLVNRLISSIFNQLNENELTTSTLGDVTYRAGRIGWKGLTKKEYVDNGRLFLSVHGLNYGKYVDFRDAFRITQARYDESPEIMLKKGDILLCKDGAGIGKLAIVPDLPEPATINSSLLLIRPLKNITSEYVYYSLLSSEFQKIIQSQIDGSTTPHLYQKDITLFPFSYPALQKQKEITEKISSAISNLEKLQNYSKKNIENLKTLKSAILTEELQIKVA